MVGIARREAGRSSRKLLGVTASSPQYVQVPDQNDPGAQLEWVVSVRLLDGPTQAIISDDPGLQVIPNIPISHETAGDVIGDIGTPVEIDVSASGQLTVVGRAKIALPDLNLTFYSLADLKLGFVDDTEFDESGVPRDPFGDRVSLLASRSFTMTATIRMATFEELGEDDAGVTTGWGFQIFQRSITEAPRLISISFTESILVNEIGSTA